MSDDFIWGFRVLHILKAIEEIRQFTQGLSYDDFVNDHKTLRAVERNIEIIGETSAKIPQDIRNMYPEIPWSGMKGMRNAISHGYEQVEYQAVWDVVKERLPDLQAKLEKIALPPM